MKRIYTTSGFNNEEYDACQTDCYRSFYEGLTDRELLVIVRWGYEHCEKNPSIPETTLIENFRKEFDGPKPKFNPHKK